MGSVIRLVAVNAPVLAHQTSSWMVGYTEVRQLLEASGCLQETLYLFIRLPVTVPPCRRSRTLDLCTLVPSSISRSGPQNPRSICALFAGLPLLFVALDVIR